MGTMKRIAVCPGSFDPVTNGHEDIIRRASLLFDQVIVLVSSNPEKHCVFTPEERVKMLEEVTSKLPNVEVDKEDGLLVDYVREKSASAIVKGLRALSDFEYEFQMALTNKKLMPYAETVFLTTNSDNMYLSSSMVRQIARLGGDISGFVPKCVLKTIVKRLHVADQRKG